MLKSSALLLFLLFSISLNAQSSFDKIFVDQEWLLENASDESLVLLHVGNVEDYNTGHIQGALMITSQEFSTARGDIRWEIPDKEAFKIELMERGITNETVNILYYGSGSFAPTFRLYFTLKYFGLEDNTYILDGGMPGWVAKNRRIQTKPNKVQASDSLYLEPRLELIVSKEMVIERSEVENTTIIDARNNNYYTGEEDGDGHYKRPGHLPGAVNITWTKLVDNNRFLKPEAQLKEYFDNAGVIEGNDVITYCHVGLRATVLHTIASMLGYNSQLYDGSYNEWDSLGEGFTVEKGN